MQLLDGIIYSIKRQSRIDAMQRLLQYIIQYRVGVVTLYIRPVLIAELFTFQTLE